MTGYEGDDEYQGSGGDRVETSQEGGGSLPETFTDPLSQVKCSMGHVAPTCVCVCVCVLH